MRPSSRHNGVIGVAVCPTQRSRRRARRASPRPSSTRRALPVDVATIWWLLCVLWRRCKEQRPAWLCLQPPSPRELYVNELQGRSRHTSLGRGRRHCDIAQWAGVICGYVCWEWAIAAKALSCATAGGGVVAYYRASRHGGWEEPPIFLARAPTHRNTRGARTQRARTFVGLATAPASRGPSSLSKQKDFPCAVSCFGDASAMVEEALSTPSKMPVQ